MGVIKGATKGAASLILMQQGLILMRQVVLLAIQEKISKSKPETRDGAGMDDKFNKSKKKKPTLPFAGRSARRLPSPYPPGE